MANKVAKQYFILGDNVFQVIDKNLVINGQVVPKELIKGKIDISNMIITPNGSVVDFNRNKFVIRDGSIFVNGIELKAVQKEDLNSNKNNDNHNTPVEKQEKSKKTKKDLVKKINKEKMFSKSFLKLADIETLKQIDNAVIDSENLADHLLFWPKDKIKDFFKNVYLESSNRFERNASIGLPMGIVTSVSGVVSLAAGAFIGGILSLAGAGLFLGASIPRVIEEKRILKANKEEAMTVLKKWLPDFPQKENTDSFDYSKHSLDIDKIATKENSKKASKKNLKNKGDNNNYGLIIDDKEIKGSTPKPRKSIKNKGSNNNFGIIIERKKTKGDNEPIIGCIERDK